MHKSLSTVRRVTYLPIPIPNLTSTLHLISKRLSVTLDWPPSSPSSPSSMPPRTPLACLGTSKTKLATPSAPGGMRYSGPLNGTVVKVSESRIGGSDCGLVVVDDGGKYRVRVNERVRDVFLKEKKKKKNKFKKSRKPKKLIPSSLNDS